MKKKLMFTIMLTLLAGILINNAALVQAPQSGRSRSSGRRGVGQVTAIGTDQFTATTRNDKNNQFLVDENTRFQHSYQSAASFKDLAAGQWVVVIAAPRLGESSESRPEFTARLIVLLSEEIDPAQHFSVHTRGVITGTNLAASTFQVRDLNGQILTLAVNENTHFLGQIEGLSDLQPGMLASVAARQENGDLVAQLVVAADRSDLPQFNQRAIGRIVAISRDRFVIEKPSGERISLLVTTETRFRSPGGRMQNLEDPRKGMRVVIGAREVGGSYQAVIVVVGSR